MGKRSGNPGVAYASPRNKLSACLASRCVGRYGLSFAAAARLKLSSRTA